MEKQKENLTGLCTTRNHYIKEKESKCKKEKSIKIAYWVTNLECEDLSVENGLFLKAWLRIGNVTILFTPRNYTTYRCL